MTIKMIIITLAWAAALVPPVSPTDCGVQSDQYPSDVIVDMDRGV